MPDESASDGGGEAFELRGAILSEKSGASAGRDGTDEARLTAKDEEPTAERRGFSYAPTGAEPPKESLPHRWHRGLNAQGSSEIEEPSKQEARRSETENLPGPGTRAVEGEGLDELEIRRAAEEGQQGTEVRRADSEASGREAPADAEGQKEPWRNRTTRQEPRLRAIRRFGRGPRVPWWRSVLPTIGLVLCVGCLWELIDTWQWPNWQPWWSRPEMVGKGLVVIDPGHGGEDSGAVAQGVVEKDLNLDVGMRVARALRTRSVDVRLTREDDHFVPLEDRVRFANALPGAVFVSIHFNDAAGEGKTNPQASGIETYYCEHKLTPAGGGWTWASLLGRGKATAPDARRAVQEGQTLAGCIQGTLIAGTGAENRGIKERSLYVTHRVLGPAVLVEGGFVSHPGEARRLGDPTYRQVLAESITEGIVKYLRAAQTAPVAAAAGP